MERIDYPALVRSALLGMVRQLLERAATEGLPGEHHFYLGFRTDAPGVEMPAGLRQSHPREMTIVLQHQFWDLGTTESGFAVTLRFSGAPTRLVVPWEALTAFADPSVPFGLRLTTEPEAAQAAPEAPVEPSADTPAASASPPNVIAFRRRQPPDS